MINLVIDILKANTTLTNLVSTDNIYPLIQLQGGNIPSVVVQLTNTTPNDTQEKVSTYDDNSVEVTCFAISPAAAWAISEAVRGAIDGYTGGNIAQIRFQSQATDIFESTEVFSVTQGYSVHLKRDGATLPTAIAGLGLFNLDDINNVDNEVVNALDRQALVYDEATSQWIADGVGQVVIPVRNPSKNNSIAVGTVLKATGAQGDRILVAPFNADLDDPRYLVGIASEELGATAETKDGHAQVYGELRDIDTDIYEVGDILYPDSTGALVTTENQYPIAIVLRKQQNTGRIFIRTWTPGRSRYDADVETLRQEMDTSLANADIELYFSAQADGYGLVESPGSDSVVNSTPPEDYQVERAIYYNNTGLASYISDSGWSTLTTNTESYAAAKARVEDYIRGGTYGKLPCTFAIVRTEETVRTGLLVDYPGAAAAYSLRLLDTDYAGSAIRVRRASDNAEQDIGFDGNGDLDTTALATFCSGTDGFVKVWYDQSGNANDAEQTSTAIQAKIFDATENDVITNNGKPAIQPTGSPGYATGVSGLTDTTIIAVGNNALAPNSISTIDPRIVSSYAGAGTLGANQLAMTYRSTTNIYRAATSTNEVNVAGNGQPDNFIVTFKKDGSNGYLGFNGSAYGTTSIASITNELYLFEDAGGGNAELMIAHHEIIIYDSAQNDTNRTGIETNINTYYNIF